MNREKTSQPKVDGMSEGEHATLAKQHVVAKSEHDSYNHLI